ncbi:putative SWI/SNF-related matrix-associated actin-dependent regulator of chromatin subfamily A member 3-like 1 [Arachis hypogaea]|uniref:putative SWI/SNF-related matrix-associated actin-dependent regulator of chromatin subfamily A member 3-like 1 n=1 Tax=Arachis hypogaea TaxID=3818 RepID=UPI000DEDD695|nr:putative SWI/SNF-related matrix-associated actin-dependent regulator of chromatin subfamily A member 3-like 1 [Arachis hypogaea]
MVMHHNSKRRWTVTAISIEDGYVDAFAFMSFLDFEPFSNRESWNWFIQRPINQGLDSCHKRLEIVLPTCFSSDVSNNPRLLRRLVETLQECEAYECPICSSPSANIVITCCSHIFCRVCILRIIQSSGSPHCPLCRRALSESDLFSAPIEPSRADSTSTSSSSDKELSSKTSALIKFLKESREQKPTAKSVVFSQFRKVLVLLKVTLKEAGFKTLRIDGLMTAEQRAGVIDQFQDTKENGPTVLLAGLRVSGADVNLTAATTVYFMEPWWNAAVKEQAMDRVHCIGKKEAVRIVRLVVWDSIEEKMLMLQEEKRGSHSGSLKYKDLKYKDLNFLMSIE